MENNRKIQKEKEQLTGKIPLPLIFNYPLFSLKQVIATLSDGTIEIQDEKKSTEFYL